ncbi:PhoH family protein [Alkalihalobacillus sp. 1P02AB]|uniref:PhoH family protein n=1 Tax=Alkalihalobacillus sp. 1P02AB TaxID=3132260 RepID=UPI0039A69F5B
MSDVKVLKLDVKNTNETQALFGPNDRFLKQIEMLLQVSIVTRGEEVTVTGEGTAIDTVEKTLTALIQLIRKGVAISERDVVYTVQLAKRNQLEELHDLYEEKITTNIKGKSIIAKTLGQRHYVSAINQKDMVFGIGPAGTGKTYLAVVMAVTALKDGHVKRIVLTRPAVEAGESLGFLPGDLKEKVDPYLRPIYDALHDVLGVEHTTRLMERGTIEVAPLAYMRGRTLEDAFVILDEAQNTTSEQIKMFITRLGFGSKMVINGDLTQIDLPRGKKSGLKTALETLAGIQAIGFIYLHQVDVVRHSLVQRIIQAYESTDKKDDERPLLT